MPEAAARAVPRLVNDTYRTYLGLGVVMVLSAVVNVAYGAFRDDLGLPRPGLRYVAASTLGLYALYFVVYQLLTWGALRRADARQLANWARLTNPRSRSERRLLLLSGSGARTWAATAAGSALLTVLLVLLVPELRGNAGILAASLLVVTSSWSVLAQAYALAYLRLSAEEGGLEFPGGAAPVWSDYTYLAIQVNATFSSSDVEVTSTRMRRLVTGQTVLAFVFNTVILALLVSALVALGG
jgi:uncharacterized membrane protein